jgi:hypothetical protein
VTVDFHFGEEIEQRMISQSYPIAVVCLPFPPVGWTGPIHVRYVCLEATKTGFRAAGKLAMPNTAATAAALLSVAPMMDGAYSCLISVVYAVSCAAHVQGLIA